MRSWRHSSSAGAEHRANSLGGHEGNADPARRNHDDGADADVGRGPLKWSWRPVVGVEKWTAGAFAETDGIAD
jgi:hypothetical protein